MKRKFFLLILVLLLSGCSATYKLEIKDDDFKEDISISMESSEKSNISYFKNNKFYAIMDGASDFREYNKKVSNNQTESIAEFSYKYDGLEFSSSTILSSCFNAYNVVSQDDYYIISTSEGIRCATEENNVLLDSIKVIIKTNHVVKKSNANYVNGHEYSWEFNKDDYEKGNIYIKLYKDKYVFNYNNEFTIKLMIVLGIIIVVAISIFIIIKKVRKARQV